MLLGKRKGKKTECDIFSYCIIKTSAKNVIKLLVPQLYFKLTANNNEIQ